MTITLPPHADVLVVHASRNGETATIATTVAEELRAHGLTVDVATAADAAADRVTLARYRAVVLGSAVHAGRWQPAAMRFLRRHRVMLRARQVWLFQAGSRGPDAEHGAPEPRAVRELREDLVLASPVTFGGVPGSEVTHGFSARWTARGPLAGAACDAERVRAWARGIAVRVRPLTRAG